MSHLFLPWSPFTARRWGLALAVFVNIWQIPKHLFSSPPATSVWFAAYSPSSPWEFFRFDLCGSQTYSPGFCKIMKWNPVMNAHASGVKLLSKFQNHFGSENEIWESFGNDPVGTSALTDACSFLSAFFRKCSSVLCFKGVFLPLSLRDNWHASLCKLKVCSMMAPSTYIVTWWPQ